MDIKRIVELINIYRESNPLVSFIVLEKIEKLLPIDCDIVKEDNCQSLRQTVSDLLFN